MLTHEIDLRFHLDSDAKAGFETKAMLCLPFFGRVNPETGEAELLGVATLINKITSQDTSVSEDAFFSNEDILQFSGILNILGMAITNSVLYKSDLKAVRESQKLIEENKVAITKSQEEARRFQTLLEFATSVYKEDDLQKLVQKIIVHARDLLNADRASVFLVDKERKEVYSSVFDSQSVSAIRFPINKGIVGYVASSGNVVNLPDAYQDARFNPSVDLSTGYRTRSMLSIPIYGPSKEIVAVASLINKMEATRPSVFGAADVEIFEAFAAFCGLALHKTLLLQETKTQKQMLSVTMELMSYHSTARPDELQNFLKNAPSSFVPAEDLRTFRFNAHQFDSDPDGLARICVQMFQDLDYLRKFEIEEEKLIRYVLTVKRNYRPVLYHNFGHAISVSHAMYLLVKLGVVGQYLTELETFSMFIAALNHDIDHRGTNNQFQKSAQTALAVSILWRPLHFIVYDTYF